MKTRITVTVDPEVIKETKLVLKDTGVTLSGFIGVALRGLVDSRTKPMSQMYEDMAIEMVRKVTEPYGRSKKKSAG